MSFVKASLLFFCLMLISKEMLIVSPQIILNRSGACSPFNPCRFSRNVCANGGLCFINPDTCGADCNCTAGYTGDRCEIAVEEDSEYDENGLPPYHLRNCSQGIVCQYGICIRNTAFTGCECLDGWVGVLCDINTTLPSTLEDIINSTSPKPSGNGDDWLMTTLPTVSATRDARYNICKQGHKNRTEEEKNCSFNFGCVYGVCTSRPSSGPSFSGTELECTCDIGGYGTFCEHECCLYCGENGYCEIYQDKENKTYYPACSCRRYYTGGVCEIYNPPPVNAEIEEVTWYLWVVGGCAGMLLLLLLLLVVTPYLMWKHRVILIMKIVHYFQPYEDDDDKQWDAFISYKADQVDEDFVVHRLYPKLEKEFGFKLCLHFRDFVPGETIANNIINAVEGSRRTIMILTPRYIQSEFTKFEYQKAQHEMLQRKHRIIPVVLEDISSVKPSMDKNLKGIIESVTYLEWPGDDSEKKVEKFWKRLRLSLPKKKSSSSSFEGGVKLQSSVSVESSATVDSYLSCEGISENIYSEIMADEGIIRPICADEEGIPSIAPGSVNISPSKISMTEHVDKNTRADKSNNLILNVDDLNLHMSNLQSNDTSTTDTTNSNVQRYIELLDHGVQV